MSNEIDELFEKALVGLSPQTASAFFRDIDNKFVYFYSANEIESKPMTQILNFDSGELLVPFRTIDDKNFAVMYTNKATALENLEPGFTIVKAKARQFLDVARNMSTVDGVLIQGASSWFTILLNQLELESSV
jgi:hypothetical protein